MVPKPTWAHMFTIFLILRLCKSRYVLKLIHTRAPWLITDRFGPNTFPAHNSALFSCEVQIDYIARTLLAPIIDQRVSVVEIKGTAEDQWVNGIHQQLKGSVFEAGCSNWYINSFGRNSASWPGYASTFWKETLIPHKGVFVKSKGSNFWYIWTVSRWLRTTSMATYTLLGLLLASGYLRRTATGKATIEKLVHNILQMVKR